MGCGASVAPTSYVPPDEEPEHEAQQATSAKEVTVNGPGGGITIASHTASADDPKRKDGGPKLPFVRFDTSAVPKEIKGGDHVYIVFTYSGNLLQGDGGAVSVGGPNYSPECVFRLERKDNTNKILEDGEDVFLCHEASGMYVEGTSDTEPLILASKDDRSPGQLFSLGKQGRPLMMKHRDTVYLQTWLSNYAQEGYFEANPSIYAKRWQRRQPNTLTILKKAVVESSSTELARKFQFQAFDLDGNGSISKSEMHHMLRMVKGEVSDEDMDEVMLKADPAHTGNIPFASFATWADNGGLEEESLQHIEVLGNISQRCNDCLHDGDAMIEVTTTIGLKPTQDMLKKYEAMGYGDLSAEIVKKASEQDGWIFSSNWKKAMQALLEDEVDLWVRCLNDAMEGWGTDEWSLTALVCTIPERLRTPIFKKYLEITGKGLLDHIKSETSFSYQKVMMWQAMPPGDCRASILNNAMVGLGTSEDQLIRVICACDFAERREIQASYERMYSRNLIEHIKSETSGDFQKSLICMLEAEEAEFDLDADCAAMKEAMDGWGTDEEKLIRMICNKTSKQMEDVNKRFEKLYDKSLLTRVENETSGYFKDTMQGCVRHPSVQLAHSVRDCIKGFGTDDTGLITCLVHLEDFKKAALIKSYKLEFEGRDLLKDIKSDTSGSYEKALIALVKPAPEVWAEALTGAMKGLGTNDALLINFMVLAKDDMKEVRKSFYELNGKYLEDWIDGDCGGADYKKTLLFLAARNSEDDIDMMPVYWSQRSLDAVRDVETLKDVLCGMPAVALKRHTEIYEKVYGKSLRQEIASKCDEGRGWFSFSSYWKQAMLALLDMPVERYVKGLYDAMNGWGTDEFTLTALVSTLPENLYEEIHALYETTYNKKLSQHIESETSFSYKKCLLAQAMSFPESRATALRGAMVGWGTSEDQLIRVVVCATMRERDKICEAYKRLFDRNLIDHISSETSGSFKNILVALLKNTKPKMRPPYDKDCEAIKKAMDGFGTDEGAIIKIVAGKTPEQIQTLQDKFQEKYDQNLFQRIDDETCDWGTSMFTGSNFRACMLGLMRKPIDCLAYAVRDCMEGFGTDDTGLVTLLTHLSERKRRELVEAFKDTKGGGDIYAWIEGDTSGNYKKSLIALVRPPPYVWAQALHGAMKGLGTSDNLLINWMCLSKGRMDEVRDAFREQYGQELAEWIDGDCSGDYKDTLIKLANRACMKFAGAEAGLTIAAPADKYEALLMFTRSFNKMCKTRKEAGGDIPVPEVEAQAMGAAFLFYSQNSSCAPNLDKAGLWDFTNAVGFPPGDAGPDLDLTFNEWNYSGSGEIAWNDFVREMNTRINDPGHYNAEALPESAEGLDALNCGASWEDAARPEAEEDPPSEEDEPERRQAADSSGEEEGEDDDSEGEGNFLDTPSGHQKKGKRTWRKWLKKVEPTKEDDLLCGPWAKCLEQAVKDEHAGEANGAAGEVLDFMQKRGHDDFMKAAERLEEKMHQKFG